MSMIHQITEYVGANKAKRRKGRGESSRGKTCGRGNKGSKARVGTYIKPTYEGGQTELFRRFPIRGFSNFNFERKFYVVNLADLAGFDSGTTVDAVALMEKGLIPDSKLPVKILGDGELKQKLTVVAGWYSKGAHEKIIAAGGTAQNAKGEAFAFPAPKKKFIPREAGKKTKKLDADAGEEKPTDAKPTDAKPTDAKPTDAKSPDAKPSESKSSDAKPASE
jgi:large subunit ribosomal protein L15